MASKLGVGIPTDADVRLLFDTFGVPAEGQRLGYDIVAGVLRIDARSNRFRTVTDRWRRRLFREHNVLMVAEVGTYVACDPGKRIDVGERHHRSGLRHHRKTVLIISTTDQGRLSPEQKTRATHLQHNAATALQAAKLAAKQDAPALPPPVAKG